GYAVTPTTIEGVSTGDTAGTATPRTMTLGGAMLMRETGIPATGATGDVLLTSDGQRIYSVASRITSGFDGFKIRAYNSNGSLVSTASPDVSVPMPSYTTDGVVCDGANLYLLESGGTSRVTKISTQTWKVVGQWRANWASDGIIGGCYDRANNVFWLGSYNSGRIRRYAGPGFDLRDSARGLYAKTGGTSFDARSDYRFAVVPYNSAGEIAPAAANWKDVALENRTIGVNDDPRHTAHSLGDLAGDSAEVRFDTGSLELDASDLSIASWGPAAGVSRHYTSSQAAAGSFGAGWRFNFEQSVTASGAEMVYTDETGERHAFVYSAATSAWVAPNGYFATLVLSTPPIGSHYWTLTFKDRTVLTFDKLSGAVTSEKDVNGNQVTYTRANGDLTITAANGQTIFVDYEAGKAVSATQTNSTGTRAISYASPAGSATVTRFGGTSCAYATTYAYTSSKLTGISVPSASTSWS
ncbi:MAG: DUF6531 domain-containing protein, partial [Coriobacteriia bacterium]|nr:DUF6531 domain-containing protein [Coriobacteriia bacterium]